MKKNYFKIGFLDLYLRKIIKFVIRRYYLKNIKQLGDIVEKQLMKLSIEITNICNANCQFCGYKYLKRDKFILSNEQFQLILNKYVECGGGDLKVTPIVGDPLIDKNLIKKIKMAKAKKEIKSIDFFTNLIGLKNFNISELIMSGIDELQISACIYDRQMYKRIFGVDQYDNVLNNLKVLIVENKRLNNKVHININQICEKPYSNIFLSKDYKEVSKLFGSPIPIRDDDYDNWTGLIKKKDLPKGQRFRKIKDLREPCSQFYNGVIVLMNGDIDPCWCRDVEAQLVIGNIYEDSLYNIWTGAKIKELRENWWKGNFPAVCKNCSMYTSLSEFLLENGNKILGKEMLIEKISKYLYKFMAKFRGMLNRKIRF